MKPTHLSTLLATLGLVATLLGSQAALAQSTAGEVTRINRAQQKITLRHETIVNLDMPAMTMVFRVRDPAQLDALQVGDKVRFDAEQQDGQLVVTRIVPAAAAPTVPAASR